MDLSTTYLGMKLKNPIVPSASPLSRSVSSIRQLEDAGASAVVLYSLFEEELNHESRTLDRYLTEGTESYAEALSYFPEAPTYDQIRPGFLLGTCPPCEESGGYPGHRQPERRLDRWLDRFAKEIEGAGADALELNVYYLPTNLDLDRRRGRRYLY